jgi:hypothetical protein
MFDRSDHGVPFSREFRSRGAEGSIESVNAVQSGSGDSRLEIRYGSRTSLVEGRGEVGLCRLPLDEYTVPIRDENLVQSGGDSRRYRRCNGIANALV